MTRITDPTADTPATLNARKWYIGNEDEGVTAGPFNSKSDALCWTGGQRTRKDCGGLYQVIDCDGDLSHELIGRGDSFAYFVGVTVA